MLRACLPAGGLGWSSTTTTTAYTTTCLPAGWGGVRPPACSQAGWDGDRPPPLRLPARLGSARLEWCGRLGCAELSWGRAGQWSVRAEAPNKTKKNVPLRGSPTTARQRLASAAQGRAAARGRAAAPGRAAVPTAPGRLVVHGRPRLAQVSNLSATHVMEGLQMLVLVGAPPSGEVFDPTTGVVILRHAAVATTNR